MNPTHIYGLGYDCGRRYACVPALRIRGRRVARSVYGQVSGSTLRRWRTPGGCADVQGSSYTAFLHFPFPSSRSLALSPFLAPSPYLPTKPCDSIIHDGACARAARIPKHTAHPCPCNITGVQMECGFFGMLDDVPGAVRSPTGRSAGRCRNREG